MGCFMTSSYCYVMVCPCAEWLITNGPFQVISSQFSSVLHFKTNVYKKPLNLNV